MPFSLAHRLDKRICVIVAHVDSHCYRWTSCAIWRFAAGLTPGGPIHFQPPCSVTGRRGWAFEQDQTGLIVPCVGHLARANAATGKASVIGSATRGLEAARLRNRCTGQTWSRDRPMISFVTFAASVVPGWARLGNGRDGIDRLAFRGGAVGSVPCLDASRLAFAMRFTSSRVLALAHGTQYIARLDKSLLPPRSKGKMCSSIIGAYSARSNRKRTRGD